MKIALAWNDATTTANRTDIARVRQPSMNSAHVTRASGVADLEVRPAVGQGENADPARLVEQLPGQRGRPRRTGAPDLVAVRELAEQEGEVEQPVPDAQHRRRVQGDRPLGQEASGRVTRSSARCACDGRLAAAVRRGCGPAVPAQSFHARPPSTRADTGFRPASVPRVPGGSPAAPGAAMGRVITRSWMASKVPLPLGGDAVHGDVAQVLLHHQGPLRARLVVAAVRFEVAAPGAAQHVLCRMAREDVVLDGGVVHGGQIEPVAHLFGAVRGGVRGPRRDLPVDRFRIRGEEPPVLFEQRVDPGVDLPAVTLRDGVRRGHVQKHQEYMDRATARHRATAAPVPALSGRGGPEIPRVATRPPATVLRCRLSAGPLRILHIRRLSTAQHGPTRSFPS